MADVVVTVMIDGKQAFVSGVAGTPDALSAAASGLQLGLAHFMQQQEAVASRRAQPSGLPQSAAAQQVKDSL